MEIISSIAEVGWHVQKQSTKGTGRISQSYRRSTFVLISFNILEFTINIADEI